MELHDFFRKHKDKIFNINILIIILSLIIANNIYKKQGKEIISLKAKNEVEIKKNKVLEGVSGIEKRMASYKKLLIKKDMGEVINNISTIARNAGVEIVSIRPETQVVSAEYIKRPLRVEFKSQSFHKIGKFISELESHSDVYIVDSLEIKTDRATKGLIVNLRLGSVVYLL